METPEEQQMKAVFKSARAEVDPVSGNEVPPGSLPEEVRDDIPAQLSEGEYVVPADVVRYYGVKYFEDLRTQAKMGLQQMDADGRIGGEPIGMGSGEEPLSAEEEAELNAIMGFAEGGEVPANTQVSTDFSQSGITFMGDPVAEPATPSTNVTLYGPAGEVVPLILPADQIRYDELIAQGYSTEPKPQVNTSNRKRKSRSVATTAPATTEDTEPALSLSEMSDEQLTTAARGLSTIHKIGRGVSALGVGLIPSAIIGTQTAARYNDVLEELERRGVENDFDRASSIFGGEKGVFTNLRDVNNDGKENFGDTWLGDFLGFDGEFGNQGPSLKESRQGARRYTTDEPDSSSTPSSSSSSGNTLLQNLANAFTPNDGKSYVDGELKDDE